MNELLERLEKTAGVAAKAGKYIKDVSGINLAKAKKAERGPKTEMAKAERQLAEGYKQQDSDMIGIAQLRKEVQQPAYDRTRQESKDALASMLKAQGLTAAGVGGAIGIHNLMENEKTAAELVEPSANEMDEAKKELLQYGDTTPATLLGMAGGAVVGGIPGATLFVNANNRKNFFLRNSMRSAGMGAGALGTLLGAGYGGMATYDAANYSLNKKHPERAEALENYRTKRDKFFDDSENYWEQEYNKKQSGGNQMKTANENELMKRLEKTANAFMDAAGAVGKRGGQFVDDVLGRNVAKAKGELNQVNMDMAGGVHNMENAYVNALNNVEAAQRNALASRAAVGAGAGAGVGGAVLANNFEGRHTIGDEEAGVAKTAEQLMAELEKTAAANFASKTKNFFKNVGGGEARQLKQKSQQAEKMLNRNIEKGTISGDAAKDGVETIKKYEAQAAEAKKATNKARAQLTGGAALVGAGAAGANALTKKNDQEKTASEEHMSELYKEAAAQIIDQQFPSVQSITDPMSRIKFER